MQFALPTYKISETSPIEDLLVLEHLYSEVGGFTSTILDEKYLTFSQECVRRLEYVSKLLEHKTDSLEMRNESTHVKDGNDLSSLSVDELYHLYRSWPERHKEREAEGREPLTFYFEGKIVRELKSRKHLTENEQLKVAYCDITYRCELENMSFIFSVPVSSQAEEVIAEKDKVYTQSELITLVNKYSNFKTIEGRERLVEYLDMALDRMKLEGDKTLSMELATEIVELRRRDIIKVPSWTISYLEEVIGQASTDSHISEKELILPILTLNLQHQSSKLVRKAQLIINRAYKDAFKDDEPIEKRIDDLLIAVTYCDYVTRYSVRKVAKLWNEISSQVSCKEVNLTRASISNLLEIANEIEDFAKISLELKDEIKQMLIEN